MVTCTINDEPQICIDKNCQKLIGFFWQSWRFFLIDVIPMVTSIRRVMDFTQIQVMKFMWIYDQFKIKIVLTIFFVYVLKWSKSACGSLHYNCFKTFTSLF
jgi:hypothetical protein